MKNHYAYLKYVLRHKWYVFLACRKMKVPLRRAIVHDWTKFTPIEWSPYVHNFFNADGTNRNVRDASGAYDPNSQSDEYKLAWLNHQRNPHHWTAWLSVGNYGEVEALPIPETYIREMIADWIGAGMAISGRKDPRPWYQNNAKKMVIHYGSRITLERLLEEHAPYG